MWTAPRLSTFTSTSNAGSKFCGMQQINRPLHHLVVVCVGWNICLQDLNVRRNSAYLDGATGRRKVTRRGELQGAIFLTKRYDGLNLAKPERATSDDCCAFVVLQGAGKYLGTSRCTRVNQHDNRFSFGAIARIRLEANVILRLTPRVETILPRSKNSSEMEIALSSRPPGLFRTSMM